MINSYSLLSVDVDIIFAIVIVAVVIGVVVAFVTYLAKMDRDYRAKHPDDNMDALPQYEPLPEQMPEPDWLVREATVKDKLYGSHFVGLKVAQEIMDFEVLFVTVDGVEVKCRVSQNTFDELQIGQTGTLVTANGNFTYFGNGEDVNDNIEAENIDDYI